MENERLSRISALALNGIFGYEPKFSHNLIDALGSTEKVFMLSPDERLEIFGPHSRYLPLINDEALREAEREYDRLRSLGYEVLGIYDEDYPELLRDCSDAPLALYVRSETPVAGLFNSRPMVSIVGTRDISLYGKEWCERIVGALSRAKCKPVIVSGMAMGVDITAHMAALAFGLPTVGVLPVGIEDVYPARHRVAASKIVSAEGGAMVTDYPCGTSPLAFNFIRRNRIIAGLCRATILVESKPEGGGMLTARLAAGYGRDVFALPGRIDDLRSAGCNALLREKIAEPVTDVDALPPALGLGEYHRRKAEDLESELRARFAGALGDTEMSVLVRIALAIRKLRGITYEEICEDAGIGYADVCRFCGLLETEGFINVDLMQRCSLRVLKVFR